MKVSFIKTVALLFVLCSWVLGTSAMAASPSASLLKAKTEAEAKGYIFETSHDEIVAKAKREGKLQVLTGLRKKNYPHLISGFKKKYPFIDVEMAPLRSAVAQQRFLLELKAGTVKNWDVFYMSADFYNLGIPFAKKFEILGMAKQGVLDIPIKMVDPSNRDIVAAGNSIGVVAYNKKLISPEKVPNKWEDFLKPEFKGRKLFVDIRPQDFAVLAEGLGEEWVKDYARKLRDQESIWMRGLTRALTAMVAGEAPLHQLVAYQSCFRFVGSRRPTSPLVCKFIEPIPARLHLLHAVVNSASHPYAGILWIEFLTTPLAQKIIDKYEPVKSSMYSPGSAIEKATRGKKLSVVGWDSFHLVRKRMKMVVEAFGFPTATRKKR